MTVYWIMCFASVAMAWLTVAALNFKKSRENRLEALSDAQAHDSAIFNCSLDTNSGMIISLGMLLSSLPLVIVSGIRYDVGKDYLYTYVPYFQHLLGNDDLSKYRMEPGYWLINYAVAFFTDNYMYVFLICAVIFFFFTYSEIIRASSYPALSVFLIVGTSYFFVYLNTMRQMTAIAILLFSIRYIERRELKKFLLCILAASLLHYSCVIFIIMYFIGRVKIKPVPAFISVGAVLVLSSLLSFVLRLLISYTGYSVYNGSRFDTGEGGYIIRAMCIAVLIFAAVMYDEESLRYRIYFNCQLLAVYISLVTGGIPLAGRLRWIFGYPVIILIPMACSRIKKMPVRMLVKSVIIAFYIAYIAITIGIRNGNSVLPYQTVFDR